METIFALKLRNRQITSNNHSTLLSGRWSLRWYALECWDLSKLPPFAPESPGGWLPSSREGSFHGIQPWTSAFHGVEGLYSLICCQFKAWVLHQCQSRGIKWLSSCGKAIKVFFEMPILWRINHLFTSDSQFRTVGDGPWIHLRRSVCKNVGGTSCIPNIVDAQSLGTDLVRLRDVWWLFWESNVGLYWEIYGFGDHELKGFGKKLYIKSCCGYWLLPQVCIAFVGFCPLPCKCCLHLQKKSRDINVFGPTVQLGRIWRF